MSVVRAFIAVKVGEDISSRLGEAVREFRESHTDIRWVHQENFHLTLKFLGDCDEKSIKEAKTALKKIGADFPPIKMTSRGIEAIPNPRWPKVICGGISNGANELKNLAKTLDSELETFGFSREEREFLPHITLGRLKSFRAKSNLMMKIREYHNIDFGSILVKDFYLIKSELMPGGAIYSDIAKIPLKKGGEK